MLPLLVRYFRGILKILEPKQRSQGRNRISLQSVSQLKVASKILSCNSTCGAFLLSNRENSFPAFKHTLYQRRHGVYWYIVVLREARIYDQKTDLQCKIQSDLSTWKQETDVRSKEHFYFMWEGIEKRILQSWKHKYIKWTKTKKCNNDKNVIERIEIYGKWEKHGSARSTIKREIWELQGFLEGTVCLAVSLCLHCLPSCSVTDTKVFKAL